MFSPTVKKHFPSGTSPYPSPQSIAFAQVTVPQNVIDRIATTKEILNDSHYTAIDVKRDCLNVGLVPLEQKLYYLQSEYCPLYSSYEALRAKHNSLIDAATNLIKDVEEEYMQNAANRRDLQEEHKRTVAELRDVQEEHNLTVAELHDLQKEHKLTVAKLHDLQKEHNLTVAELHNVQEEHKKLNAAKLQHLLQIMNATNVDSLPISRPAEPVPETPVAEDKPAHVITPLGSPYHSDRAEPKQKATEIPPQQFDSEEKTTAALVAPNADVRVSQDNYPDFHNDQGGDLSDAFATAVSFKTNK